MSCQKGILAEPVPPLARHVFFELSNKEKIAEALNNLAKLADGQRLVVGLGHSVFQALNKSLEKLKTFPAQSHRGIDVPATQHALWCWLLSDDRGDLLFRTRELQKALAPAFNRVEVTEAFRYMEGRDLSGYEDGTENPKGDEAVEVVTDDAMPGGSYAVIQHWEHDLDYFHSLARQEQDEIIGRRLSDNEEMDDAPESAHVKRTAMEDFEPPAFMVRRSMPYIDGDVAGLVFLAFADSFDAFEVQMQRMLGVEDGIVDALFRFSRPVSGGYYWCPPMQGEQLDLSGLLGE